jgi:hypothetical protein
MRRINYREVRLNADDPQRFSACISPFQVDIMPPCRSSSSRHFFVPNSPFLPLDFPPHFYGALWGRPFPYLSEGESCSEWLRSSFIECAALQSAADPSLFHHLGQVSHSPFQLIDSGNGFSAWYSTLEKWVNREKGHGFPVKGSCFRLTDCRMI